MIQAETYTIYTTTDGETFSNETCAMEHELEITYPNGLEMRDCDNERLDNSWRSLPYAYFMIVPRNALEWLSMAYAYDGQLVPTFPGQFMWDENNEEWIKVTGFKEV